MELKNLFTVFKHQFQPLLTSKNTLLYFNFPESPDLKWWDIDTIHASFSQYKPTQKETPIEMHIFLFGGLARIPEYNKDVVSLVLCHELGHGLGGPPYKNSGSSVEGQSDYFAIQNCFPRLLSQIPIEHEDFLLTSQLQELDQASREKRVPLLESDIPQALWEKCLRIDQNPPTSISSSPLFQETFQERPSWTPFSCYRALWAISLYRGNMRFSEPRPSFIDLNTLPDGFHTEAGVSTDLSDDFIPSNLCRLKTLVNGLFDEKRPSCWFKSELTQPSPNEMTKEHFEELIYSIIDLFKPEFTQSDFRVKIISDWDSPKEIALSNYEEDEEGEIRTFEFHGGLARNPVLTPDAFAAVICHEIGHHLGGEPKTWKFSVEGQADYFTTWKCLRRFFQVEEHQKGPWMLRHHFSDSSLSVSSLLEPEEMDYLKPYCEQLSDGLPICWRIIQSVKALSSWFAKKRNLSFPLAHTPDTHIVDQTFEGISLPQCRYDTFIAGLFCTEQNSLQLPPSVPCSQNEGIYGKGARPACWYSENKQ